MKASRSHVLSLILVVLLLVLVPAATQAAPAIRVTKSPANQTVQSGGTATFSINVTNTGDTVLSPLIITDTVNGVRDAACSRNISSLAIGASTIWSCSHSGETASYYNIVNARGYYGSTLTQWNASARVTVIPAAPAIRATKTPKNQTVFSGEPASFTITLTNNGNTDLSPIMLRDFNAPECNKNISGLAVGASTSWTCSHGGETASYYNYINAQAWSPAAGKVVMWNDSARVTVVPKVAADFTASPLSGFAPLNVSFQDVSTGNPTSWSWQFGDLFTSSLKDPVHKYQYPGLYTVILTATNPWSTDTVTKSDYINAAAFNLPKVYVSEGLVNTNLIIKALPDSAFGSDAEQHKMVFENKFAALDEMAQNEAWNGFLSKLDNDIRSKMDGTIDGNPKDDWIVDPAAQKELCTNIDAMAAYVRTLG
jgi:uncharacterized repeat protein (TIGR01451 family)